MLACRKSSAEERVEGAAGGIPGVTPSVPAMVVDACLASTGTGGSESREANPSSVLPLSCSWILSIRLALFPFLSGLN